jgi:hypothetical protein
MPKNQCAYCGERFNSTGAYDRHLSVKRKTVTTPKGIKVAHEEVVTCRPVTEFGSPMKDGLPRLVWSDAKSAWVTERDLRFGRVV